MFYKFLIIFCYTSIVLSQFGSLNFEESAPNEISIESNRTMEEVYVRVSFNVISDDNGNGGVSSEGIYSMLSTLNNDFQNSNIHFVMKTNFPANDCSEYDFEENICYINNSELSDPPMQCMCFLDNGSNMPLPENSNCVDLGGMTSCNFVGSMSFLNQLFSINNYENAINIYVLPDDIHSHYAGSVEVISNNIIIGGRWRDDESILFREGSIISHEIGHCLGLYHTFESFYESLIGMNLNTNSNDGACRELVCRPEWGNCELNCNNCGDFDCSTHSEPNHRFYINNRDFENFNSETDCIYTGEITHEYSCENPSEPCENDLVGTPYTPDVHNYMGYTHPLCMNNFSAGQIERIFITLENSPILQQIYYFCGSGDVNDSGDVDILDILLAINHILENIELNEREFCRSDTDNNALLDILDIVGIVNVILGTEENNGISGLIVFSKELQSIENSTNKKLALKMLNETTVRAFHIELTFGEDYIPISVTKGWRSEQMDFAYSISDDSTKIGVVLYGVEGQKVNSGMGDILNIELKPKNLSRSEGDDSVLTLVKAANSSDTLLTVIITDIETMGRFANEILNDDLLPNKYLFSPAYPNPFNPTTTIPFLLAEDSDVNISVYDIKGRLVAELVNSSVIAGNHSVNWDGSKNTSGVYIVNMTTSTHSISQTINLVK